ncbi:hypothetical protein [Corallococcus macrosporus]|uniref:Phytoene synthase n=1 Tax=Corallococcus macrosporus DSM 14697 TaxID=1189310 RepID=A0A250JY68_9BACT|nr:hypothetical protein [Corallococcus macrosporus]ATB48580.1 hypothetical protein MYMAC_004207 [Corallococcus macrosporus DSM 14697]
MTSAVDLQGNPLGDLALAAMRRWLLEADVLGYLPQLAATESEGRLWTYFSFGVRRLEALVRERGPQVLEDASAFPEDLDAIVALREFIAAAPPLINGRRRLVEQLRAFPAERDALAQGRPLSAQELFSLWYLKALPGAYMAQRLQLTDVDEATVRRIATLSAVGLQMFDDLVDLRADLARGRLWLSAEELELLGLSSTPASELPTAAGERIVQQRKAICLEYFLAVYDEASRLTSPESRKRARSFAEGWLSFLQQGSLKLYAAGEPRPWDTVQRVLRGLPGSETAKLPVLRSVFSLLSALPLPPVKVESCRRELELLGGCPKALAPAVALETMGALEAEGDAASFDAPGTEATALERALLASPSKHTAADFARQCRESAEGSPSNLREPRLAEVFASGCKLAERSARNSFTARENFLQQLRPGSRRAPVVDAELAERFSRDGADWLALGIEALAATAREVRDGCRK